MNLLKEHRNRGFSLPEILIAMAILSVIVLGGMQAYNYFITQTTNEARKMDDLTEFNLLTKDLLKFSEGAGISTAFLNNPVRVSGCGTDEPCLRKLANEGFIDAPAGEIPSTIASNTCIQFYRDAKGKLEGKKAYGDKNYTDKIYETRDIELVSNPEELYATWTLKDENSPPIMMMKMRETSTTLYYLRTAVTSLSRTNNASKNLQYAFFESESSVGDVKTLEGTPFLIYNSLYNSHYTIQYAEDIISCQEEFNACQKLSKDISPLVPPETDDNRRDTIKTASGADYPNKVFIIKFKPIDLNADFFKDVLTRQNLPADCLTAWGEGRQPKEQYFFPSFTYSVWQEDSGAGDIGNDALNLLHLSHYYTTRDNSTTGKGLMVAVPIDIFRYRVDKAAFSNRYSLVSELWHAAEIKQKVKISNLKGPFTMSRKIGSSELGIWYNPLKHKTGATP